MAVDLAVATDLAVGDIIDALQVNLSTELASVAIAGLPLDAPSVDGYFSLQRSQRIPTEIKQNHLQFALIYQTAPTSFDTRYTKSTSVGGALRSVHIGISLLYRVSMFTPFSHYGKTELATQDVETLRGHRYNAGIINAMYKYANSGSAILRADLVSDWAVSDQIPSAVGMLGIAETIWEITQDVNVPNPQ